VSFYLWAMRSASVILFAIALLITVGAIGCVALEYHTISSMPSEYQRPLDNMQWAQLLMQLVTALQWTSVSLIGAAALWRADRWLAGKPEAAE